jgi:hypothetical protein
MTFIAHNTFLYRKKTFAILVCMVGKENSDFSKIRWQDTDLPIVVDESPRWIILVLEVRLSALIL